MREIKFRAWRKDGRKKVGGVMDYDACQCCPCETCGESHHGDKNGKEMYEVMDYDDVVWMQYTGLKDKNGKEMYEVMDYDDVVWMQYTGLKDKNGKEMYEGDLVEYESQIGKVIGVIDFILGSYEVKVDYHGHDCWVGISNEIEVIGNIYENPELIEPNGRFGQSK